MNTGNETHKDLNEELQGAQEELEIKESPAAREVEEFIKGKSAEEEAATEPEPSTDRPEVEPNDADFNFQNPYDEAIRRTLIDFSHTELTQKERENYMKAILNDEPYEDMIMFYGGHLKVRIRQRLSYTQARIFDIIKYHERTGIVDNQDPEAIMDRLQRYVALTMIVDINGAQWPCLKFERSHTSGDQSVEEVTEALRKDSEMLLGHFHKLMDEMPIPKWTAIQNAMRLFETKCAKMASEAANGDFWNARA